jgi:hypothetical protein
MVIMPHQLTFSTLQEYDPAQSGIEVEVILSVAETSQRIAAKLDTGATFCIFQREFGEALGLDIESGRPEWIGAATGAFLTYGHSVTLSALGLELNVMVYFTAQYDFSRNVLGRYGWLQQVRLGLVDYEGKLYIGAYDDHS